MILSDEKCDFLESIASFLSPKDVELVFVDSKEMQEINLEQRKQDKPLMYFLFHLKISMRVCLWVLL